MRNITALQLTADMGTGWNLGNSLDAPCGETCWGNPTTTKAMIDKIKQQGFKTIRIPTTWGPHVGGAPNYTIDEAWLDRVETVCNYAFANDMYVILNTHHEGDWLKPTYAQESACKDKLSKIWTQIANRFKWYGDYLVFETLNEPRLEGSPEEWSGGTAEGREMVNRYNKAAVDAIRATGGNNSSRFISCPTYAANGGTTCTNAFVVPNNDSKVIVAVHNYSPYDFVLQTPGISTFTSQGQATLDSEFSLLYNKFISAGRAVLIGEWSSTDKNNTTERVKHATYFINGVKSRQILAIAWDNGSHTQYSGCIFNRSGLSWYFPTIANAITSPYSGGSCNPTSIIPYVQINDGSWQQTSSVTVSSGAKVKFGPQPNSGGSWSWSGLASGTSREVTINPTSSGTATATYTNSCGAQSTQNFNITVSGGGSGTTVHLTKRNASGFGVDGGNGGANGQQIYLWSKDVNNGNQQWVEINRGGGYYSYQKVNTNYCMDGGNGGANGQLVYLWTCDANNQNQQWQKADAGSGNYRLIKRNASGYSIDGGNGGANGQNLYLWASDAYNQNQQWTFTSLKSATETTLAAGMSGEGSADILLYPNPFTSEISIRIADTENVNRIAVVDMLGKQVESIDHADVKTELVIGSSLKAGVYVVQIYSADSTRSFKIIKK
jgi:endoglucanase